MRSASGLAQVMRVSINRLEIAKCEYKANMLALDAAEIDQIEQ